MKDILKINNINETINIGKLIGKNLNKSITIALDGDIGCGKTQLTKGIALGLNIKDNITSPTFNLINEYYNGTLPLYHFDVYRLNSIDELFLIGFDDYIKSDGVRIIEWASNVKEALPLDTNFINIFKLPSNNNERIIEFNFNNEYEDILTKILNDFKKEI